MSATAAVAFAGLCLRNPRGLMPGLLHFQNWKEVLYGTFDDSSASGDSPERRTQARYSGLEVSQTAEKNHEAVQKRKNA